LIGNDFCFSVNREPVSGIEYTVPNLVDGKEYEFRVAAVNKAGPGEFGKNFLFTNFHSFIN
jgi:hypothetical protein